MKTIYYLLAICFGVSIGVLISNWSYFTLEKEISIGDIFSLIITTFVGIYIAKTIQGQLDSERSEKDILIDELKEVKEDIVIVERNNDSGIFSFDDAKRQFKVTNQKILLIEELLKESRNCKNIKCNKLQDTFSDIRRLILDISPVNGFIYIGSKKNDVEQKVIEFKSQLYKLIVSVNKS